MMKIKVDYPTAAEEKEIMQRINNISYSNISGTVSVGELESVKETVKSIHMEEKVVDYIVNISRATRKPQDYGLDIGGMISYGASPRASIWLGEAARARAFMSGRIVYPQDVKTMAPDILRHRIILSYEAEADGKTTDELIFMFLDRIEVP